MEEAHWLPHSIPKRGIQYVYEHLKESGVTHDKPLKDNDSAWSENGVVQKFDQREFVNAEDFSKSGLGKHGYLYYPKSCIKERCGLQFVFSGAADPLELVKNQIPVASKNNIALVFPSVEKNWRVASSKLNAADPDADGDEFLTSDGLQAKFVKALYDRLIKPKDSKLDYAKS